MAKNSTISLREASDRAGVSRQTIYRYAKQGKLSTVKRRDGSKGVQLAELERVFGKLSNMRLDSETVSQPYKKSAIIDVSKELELVKLKTELEAALARAEKAEQNERRLFDILEKQPLLEHKTEPGIITKAFKKLF